jgi:isochorismate hydrolase
MAEITAKITVHNPTAGAPAAQESTSDIPHLRESRVGVLVNQKQHAELVLSAIADRLSEDYGCIKTMVGHKVTTGPAKPEVIEQLVNTSDWVLLGSAD